MSPRPLPVLQRLAPAKVNLTLHLRGRRADGYHLLDSLVVFPRIGDRVRVEPAPELSLDISGPFADALPSRPQDSSTTAPENLMLRAARALANHHGRAPEIALHLEKTLPVASGLGGGSSDAAAALSLLAELWQVEIPDALALALGADVPACLRAPAPLRMQGIGEHLLPAPPLPDFWLVLVNPGVGVETSAVFAEIADRAPPAPPEPPACGFHDFTSLIEWLATQRNDLEAPARRLCPQIGQVLAALEDAPLARMSGSGASCFALLPNQHAAEALSAQLQTAYPDWWIAAGEVS